MTEATRLRNRYTNEKTGEILLKTGADKIDNVLKDAEWEVFYQLSSMREGLLNWYPFQKNSRVLELSCGYGGLTGLLCRRNKEVTVLEKSEYRARCIESRYNNIGNLILRVGTIDSLPSMEKYDYIVVEETLNTSIEVTELLDQVCNLLSKKGRILFVCNNRLGMKYLCGVPDVRSGVPFEGIREVDCAGRITRKSLLNVLERNSLIKDWQIYYPCPDSRLPQAVYTDQYLPKKSFRDRVISYYPEEEQENLIYLEDEISDALILNEVLPVFANAFLVECSISQFEKDVYFAALSTDRGKKHGFATVITRYGTVLKRILHPEGWSSLKQMVQNQQELSQHGIQCVDTVLLEDAIEMPYIEGATLIEHLQGLFQSDREGVKRIFDQLYQEILKSSQQVDFYRCTMSDTKLNRENAGVILEKAYIDMIPYNCFYHEGNFLFYDQEFVKDGYPAKYVLFRALRYTYIYIKEAEKRIPLSYFKEKYGLDQVWGIFEREEAKFVEDNRNYELYTPFYKWSNVKTKTFGSLYGTDTARLETLDSNKRFKKKRYDIEIYKKDYKLNAIKAVQMNLLKEFSKVCEENDLMYCACYGTLLGAIRHKGYVPWDDDLDLMMPRRDYDKLVEIAPNVFSPPFFFQTAENDEGCFYGGYGKVRNSSTAGLESKNQGHNCNQGIWIDIFPIDGVPASEKEKKKQKEKIEYYQRLILKKTYPEKRILWNLSIEEEDYYLRISQIFSRMELCRELHGALTSYETIVSDKVAVLSRYYGDETLTEYNRKDFEFVVWGDFEGIKIPLPVGYENCLKEDYGEDYLLYPKVEERKVHHVAVFDTKKSYVEY